jgi:hypothetical protein
MTVPQRAQHGRTPFFESGFLTRLIRVNQCAHADCTEGAWMLEPSVLLYPEWRCNCIKLDCDSVGISAREVGITSVGSRGSSRNMNAQHKPAIVGSSSLDYVLVGMRT